MATQGQGNACDGREDTLCQSQGTVDATRADGVVNGEVQHSDLKAGTMDDPICVSTELT